MSRAFAAALAGVRHETLRQRVARSANRWTRKHLRMWWDEKCLRSKWGELSFGLNGPGIALHGWGEDHNTLVLGLILVRLYINVPKTWMPNGHDIEKAYSLECTDYGLRAQWGITSWCLWWPWCWTHVRKTWLNPDGSPHHDCVRVGEYDPPAGTVEEHRYVYVLANGTVQRRMAKVHGDEMEWRWRATWLPYPRLVKRSICVNFDGEVGERTGSWKGGTVGCGYEWRPGETLEQALRRMEMERKFT